MRYELTNLDILAIEHRKHIKFAIQFKDLTQEDAQEILKNPYKQDQFIRDNKYFLLNLIGKYKDRIRSIYNGRLDPDVLRELYNDLAMNVIVKILPNFKSEKASFSTFAWHVSENLIRNFILKKQVEVRRQNSKSLDEMATQGYEPSGSGDPELESELKDAKEKIENKLQSKSPLWADIFEMWMQGNNFKEIWRQLYPKYKEKYTINDPNIMATIFRRDIKPIIKQFVVAKESYNKIIKAFYRSIVRI